MVLPRSAIGHRLPLGAVLAFPLGMDGAGIWIGLATGLAAVAVLLTARWTKRDGLGSPVRLARQLSV
jgi:MATE family multidrug resistance protein